MGNVTNQQPDFFRSSNLLIALLVSQLVVLVFWLLTDPGLRWINLGLYSFYVIWLVLLSLGLIQLATRLTSTAAPITRFFTLAFVCTVAIFIVECAAAYLLSEGREKLPDVSRFVRYWLADMLILVMFHRSWFFLDRVKELDRAEAESRLLALQARIQPHFLFNGLNTIAELTSVQPDKAEEAIQSLAMLFRVSLENEDSQHSLEKEITLCKRFASLESWRVSGGLDLKYKIRVKHPEAWSVPKLILQPLLENAIKYGKPNETGVPIRLTISESSNKISIKVVNGISESRSESGGSGIAVNNIKDRLFALYEDRYTFNQRELENEHFVLVQIPKQKVAN